MRLVFIMQRETLISVKYGLRLKKEFTIYTSRILRDVYINMIFQPLLEKYEKHDISPFMKEAYEIHIGVYKICTSIKAQPEWPKKGC